MNETSNPDHLQPADEEEKSLDLRRYWAIVTKRKWVILATVSVIVTLTVLYTLRQPKVYQAAASVIIDPQAPQVYGAEVQEVVQLGTGKYNAKYYNTQIEILNSYRLAEETVRRYELQDNLALVPEQPGALLGEKQRIQLAADALRDAVTASLDTDSLIARIVARHTDPVLAAKLANDHAESYIASNLGVRTESSRKTSKFLAQELDTAEQKLGESEQMLYEFKRDNAILSISLEDKVNLLASDLERYTAALSDARIKRIQLGSLRKGARESIQAGDVLESPIFALAETASVVNIKDRYLTANQRLLELKQELGPRHPTYIAEKEKRDELYEALQREARLAVREIEKRYETERASEAKFVAELERLRAEAFELGPKKIQYNRLTRQNTSAEEQYRIVVGRLRASNLTGKNLFGNISLHEHARVPTDPVYPRMPVNVALAALLSLALGLSLAFGLEFLDRTIKSGEDVERAVGAPLLGPIPIVVDVVGNDEAAIQRARDMYVFEHPSSQVAECCRSIRTNILFSSTDHPMKLITVSSPNPREGKTTAVIYLGTTMAQSGQRVLLMDTDMRRPRLHSSMGVSRGLGVSNLILGDADYDDVIKSTDIPNLYVIPCGPTPPNPAELLLTNRFSEILAELGTRFDRILLDSPPLQAVTDAVVLGRISDGIIMVAQAEKTTRDHLTTAARKLRDVNARILGVILNDLNMHSRKYGYYYYYGYGYSEKPAAEAESSSA